MNEGKGFAVYLFPQALEALGLWAARSAASTVAGPRISLAPTALPWYALLSLGRMTAAYALSLLFTRFDRWR